MMRHHRRLVTVCLLLGAAAMLGGCFGTFPMTRNVYNANRNVYGSVPGDSTQRKIVQSAVMWVFIPLYAVAGIADAVVFNAIEFWTGNRTAVSMRQAAPDGSTVALEPSSDGREATLTVSRNGVLLRQERLVKVSDNMIEIRGAQGDLRGYMVRRPSGDFQFQGPEGRQLQTVSAQ